MDRSTTGGCPDHGHHLHHGGNDDDHYRAAGNHNHVDHGEAHDNDLDDRQADDHHDRRASNDHDHRPDHDDHLAVPTPVPDDHHQHDGQADHHHDSDVDHHHDRATHDDGTAYDRRADGTGGTRAVPSPG